MVVDIGNTNITVALYSGKKMTDSYRLTTSFKRTSDEYGLLISDFLHHFGYENKDVADVIIASVVPKIMYSFTNSIRKYLHIEPIIVGPGIKTGIAIKIDNPREMGADKIADAVGAYYNYGGNIIVCDFGTATTFDYINPSGELIGGVIAPGIEISAQALSNRAAKLPEIEIRNPKTVLAKNTITSMQAGVVYGYIGQVEYIIKQMKKEIGIDNIKVVATGGLGRIIYEETDVIDTYDPKLTFEGLRIIYDRFKKC